MRKLLDQALASEDPVFRPAALAAVARTGFPKMAAWLLELKDPRLREGERRDILDGVMARSASREYGYDWALRNVKPLLDAADAQAFSTRLPQMLGRFCSVPWAERIARTSARPSRGRPAYWNWSAQWSAFATAAFWTT
ncbi:hypothetical protein ACFSHP_04880 [Novosphingobium panipatense]